MGWGACGEAVSARNNRALKVCIFLRAGDTKRADEMIIDEHLREEGKL